MKQALYILIACGLLCSTSCKQKTKHVPKQQESLILDKKGLECKRKNWNRVPKKAGYVQDVVSKQEYKQVK